MQIGIDSFAAIASDPTAAGLSASERLSNLLEEIVLADQVGLDVFGIGEHHRSEYLDSAPAVILAAAAGRTKRITLTSAVRWTPKTGQAGSLTHNQRNDPHVKEEETA